MRELPWKEIALPVSVRVINIATIKPIDREIVVKAARETGAIVTAEEHNGIGGLGSAVTESLIRFWNVMVWMPKLL